MNRSMSSALWCVVKGRAAAPETSECIIGVSTSTKSRVSRKFRMKLTSLVRLRNVAFTSGLDTMSR